ncbi:MULTISPECIES: hypothetical protein [Bacillota]|uniref:hypothetical protein n=1 Tax=Bacillota TaxID=1239 RepID=UPI0039EE6ED8
MFIKKKRPADLLNTEGAFYDVTLIEDIDAVGVMKTKTIRGELRGWFFDDNRGLATVMIWEIGANRAEDYYEGDIVSVKPIEKPFFNPYKGRVVYLGQKVDVYRNLHTNNGYSIRCAKTGLVLAHCSSVWLKNATFHVSESGRQKTIKEKRKRVHAFIRGELAGYNQPVPDHFLQVVYNPYFTPSFTEVGSNNPIDAAKEVHCSGKYAYILPYIEGEAEYEK